MGLEIVELLMGTEERFDIRIAAADSDRFVTVGDLYEYLCGTVGRETRRGCETQRAFYQIRKFLMRTANIPRRQVRPARRLEDLLPAFALKRKLALRRLQNETGVQINVDPGEVVTVGMVARLSIAQEASRRKHRSNIPMMGWTRVTIWQALCEVIVQELHIDPEQVVPSARFIDDLGCG